MRRTRSLLILSAALALTGCKPKESLTVAEAQQALEESSTSSQAETLLSDGVELSTGFTIGDAVQKAAQEVRDFVASQLPCAEISLNQATLTIEYGKKAGSCIYNGQMFAGKQTISVMRNDDAEVLVHHTWTDFNNGKISVSGKADVTWSAAHKSRRVVHELTWTVLTGPYKDRTGTGTGDRTQEALGGKLADGITVSGKRTWDSSAKHWELEINDVEARWRDPVPQAGSYVLTTPSGKTLTLMFERVDANTIRVTVTTGANSFDFDVSALGQVSQASRDKPLIRAGG